MAFYEQIAPIYDGLYEDVDADEAVRQWLMLVEHHVRVRRPPAPRLPRLVDLGCGTGRYLSPWAEAGFSVTGADASQGMLAHARRLQKLSRWASRIRLVRCDLRTACHHLSGGKPFDLAVAHLNFLSLFPPEDVSRILRRLTPHMCDEAVFITDCASPSLMPEPGCERFVLGGGSEVEIVTQPDGPTATVVRSYRFGTLSVSEKYWLHSYPSVVAAALSAGWRVEAVWSWRPDRDHDPWRPFDEETDGHRMLVLRLQPRQRNVKRTVRAV